MKTIDLPHTSHICADCDKPSHHVEWFEHDGGCRFMPKTSHEWLAHVHGCDHHAHVHLCDDCWPRWSMFLHSRLSPPLPSGPTP
jgi:hypothetical protein